MPRPRALRLLSVVAAAVLLVPVAVGTSVGVVTRAPLPEHEGALEVAGLSGEVTVLRDERGVPSLYAETAEDLFRAQGFVHAQDRFFEMDYRRHVTAGRLSELTGENADALAADSVVRTLGWRRVAAQEWLGLEQSTRDHLQAYADGVNAYIEGKAPEELALEYRVLGLNIELADPEPWSPLDSLAWLKAMAWDLRSNYDAELARGQIFAVVRDAALVDSLFPRYPQDRNVPVLPGEAAPVAATTQAPVDDALLAADLQAAMAAADRALAAVPTLIGQGEGTGSNSWVVSGDLTASGAPLLANDPHLTLGAPGVWTQMGLHCADVTEACPFSVSGFTFSGFPGVIIGHNADLAWGLTNMGADVTDFFLERVDAQAGTYLRDGAQVPLEVRTEVIQVAGAEPVEIEVRSTVHGPIISDVLDLGRVTSSPTLETPRGVAEVALGWTALEPGNTADAVFRFATASDAEDIAAAAADFGVPAQNIVFATTDGHIGYQAPGRIPVRARVADGPVPSDGTWPRPGWDSRYDWQGYVDPAGMPAALDPAEGFIVAANQAVTPAGTGPFLGADWDYGYRSQRIRDLLTEQVAAGTPVTVESTAELQMDAWSPYADALVPALLAVPVSDSFTGEGVALLRDWDRVNAADSAGAAFFAAVWANLLELTFHDDLPQSQWPSGGGRWLEVVMTMLEDPDHPWWDDRRTVNVVESRDEILSRTLTTARLELTVELGKDADSWQWGQLHTAGLRHPVLGSDIVPAVVRRIVNPRPIPVSGGPSSVNATAWDAASGSFEMTAGPSMRMVVDLADLDGSTWVAVTGTSGHPGSVHYTDQLAAWAEGRSYPWPFSREAVEEASAARLTLGPSS